MFVGLAAQPAEHLRRSDAAPELLEVGMVGHAGPGEAVVGIDDPVAARVGGAPVVVLDEVAIAGGGALAFAVPDGVDGDEDGSGRGGGGHRHFDVANVSHVVGFAAHEVGSGDQLGGPEFERGILGIVEDLQVVQPRRVYGAAVPVPSLRRGRALDPVVAHVGREGEVPAEETANRPGSLWILDDTLHEPLLVQYLQRLVPRVPVDEGHHAVVDLLLHHAFQHQIPLTAEFEDLLVVQDGFAVVGRAVPG